MLRITEQDTHKVVRDFKVLTQVVPVQIPTKVITFHTNDTFITDHATEAAVTSFGDWETYVLLIPNFAG